jgi:hypothetical protein
MTPQQRATLKKEYEGHLAKVIDDLTLALKWMREAPQMKENRHYGVPPWRESIMRIRLQSEEAAREIWAGHEPPR